MSLDLNLSVWVSAAVAVMIFGLVWVTISSVMSLTERTNFTRVEKPPPKSKLQPKEKRIGTPIEITMAEDMEDKRYVQNIHFLNDFMYSLSQNKSYWLSWDYKYNLIVTIRKVIGFGINISDSRLLLFIFSFRLL